MKNINEWIARTNLKRSLGALVVFGVVVFAAACENIRPPKSEPFYAETVPPLRQQLRWSNGKKPASLDPTKALAAPETDLVRAVFEGLTDIDSRSLKEIPAVAERWESSEDLKVWTFHLRKDARWSNGNAVRAQDFVASWKRLAKLDEKSPARYLVQNIVGLRTDKKAEEPSPPDFLLPGNEPASTAFPRVDIGPVAQLFVPTPTPTPDTDPPPPPATKPAEPTYGFTAVDDHTLRVELVLPDKDLPKLIAHPVFRPTYGAAELKEDDAISAETVTNGAFRIESEAQDRVVLTRSDTYWNRKAVALERVELVNARSAESALEAYRKGEVDVVTNAAFAPLALKLLAPFDDFKRTTHSAVNFYKFNAEKAPFSDRRVREALALSIDRAKLADGELEGTNQPASSLFPLGKRGKERLIFDTVKAKELLEKAGYPGGEGFPAFKLTVNRNDTQQRVARSVIKMWKQHLGIEAELDVKEAAEIEELRKTGEYDLVRRGVVLPTNDDLVNIETIVGSAAKPPSAVPTPSPADTERNTTSGPSDQASVAESPAGEGTTEQAANPTPSLILTEDDVLYDMTVIPLYFPSSFSLVKPYVLGFEVNGLDAPSLREVSIDSNWQPRPLR